METSAYNEGFNLNTTPKSLKPLNDKMKELFTELARACNDPDEPKTNPTKKDMQVWMRSASALLPKLLKRTRTLLTRHLSNIVQQKQLPKNFDDFCKTLAAVAKQYDEELGPLITYEGSPAGHALWSAWARGGIERAVNRKDVELFIDACESTISEALSDGIREQRNPTNYAPGRADPPMKIGLTTLKIIEHHFLDMYDDLLKKSWNSGRAN